jgi:hypothetical protein
MNSTETLALRMPLDGVPGMAATTAADRFGRRVAQRLSAGSADLPYDISERLRAAREQAMARRKLEPAQPHLVLGRGGAATLGLGGDEGTGWFTRIASVLPIVALACGLVFIHSLQNDRRASELAEVDAQLLTDDLPPAAYADPGFVQFLKAGRQ